MPPLESLVQRVILTALAEVRLVTTSGDVDTESSLRSLIVASACVTTLSGKRPCLKAHLRLVLKTRHGLDYPRIAACILARCDEMDCLSGR